MVALGKDSVRKDMLNRRNSLSESEMDLKNSVISENVLSLPEVRAVLKIGVYMSIQGEVSARELISGLILAEKEVFVPFMQGGEIKFTKFISFTEVVRGDYNVPEPARKAGIDGSSIGLFILPGVAFDKKGYRLGRGRGFYDRFFRENNLLGKKRVGVCFDFQLVESIPHERHDVRVDIIVTELQVVRVAK